MSTTGELPTAPADDRWSAFQDPQKFLLRKVKKKEDPGPGLEEFFRKLLRHKSPRKQHEKIFKVTAT